MAILKTNALIESFHGRIGNGLIVRTVNGKIVASSKSNKRIKESELQKENRYRFRSATAYAKAMMLIPEKKAFYQQKAKKLKLPNAYTAAITDYMRKPTIEVDVNQYKGEAGKTIKVKTNRKGFRVSAVKILIKDQEGNIREEGDLIDNDCTERWTYKTMNSLGESGPLVLLVAVSYANTAEIKEVRIE